MNDCCEKERKRAVIETLILCAIAVITGAKLWQVRPAELRKPRITLTVEHVDRNGQTVIDSQEVVE